MQLLDVTFAFALTMAALATVVTIVMEICLRVIRMRKKNFVQVLKLLDAELGRGCLEMSPDERWAFFTRVLKNPAIISPEWPTPEFNTPNNPKNDANLAGIKKRKFLAGVYETVSLEYLLRCLAESDEVKKIAREAEEALQGEFNRIARKYEEFSSSVSASFKQNSQRWSILIGVGLALVANIDGLRIFEAYRSDPKLVAAVIEKQDELVKNNEEVQAALQEYNNLQEKFDRAEEKLAEAIKTESPDIDALKKEKLELEAAMAKQSGVSEIRKAVQSSQQQIASLVSLGIPIGWDYYPNCPYGKNDLAWAGSGVKCQEIPVEAREFNESGFCCRGIQTLWNDFTGVVVWLFKVLISGILIGLGAPFWFDVAKKLSQMRKGLQSASASSEYRFSGRDANGNPKMRREIVETVLADALMEATRETVAGEKG